MTTVVVVTEPVSAAARLDQPSPEDASFS